MAREGPEIPTGKALECTPLGFFGPLRPIHPDQITHDNSSHRLKLSESLVSTPGLNRAAVMVLEPLIAARWSKSAPRACRSRQGAPIKVGTRNDPSCAVKWAAGAGGSEKSGLQEGSRLDCPAGTPSTGSIYQRTKRARDKLRL